MPQQAEVIEQNRTEQMAAFNAEDVLDRLNEAFGSSIHSFKQKQKDCILYATENDVLCILPTGYGKTLIIQSLPFLTGSSTTIVVVNGLRSILKEQASKFAKKCILVDDLFIQGLESTSNRKQVFFLFFFFQAENGPDTVHVNSYFAGENCIYKKKVNGS